MRIFNVGMLRGRLSLICDNPWIGIGKHMITMLYRCRRKKTKGVTNADPGAPRLHPAGLWYNRQPRAAASAPFCSELEPFLHNPPQLTAVR